MTAMTLGATFGSGVPSLIAPTGQMAVAMGALIVGVLALGALVIVVVGWLRPSGAAAPKGGKGAASECMPDAGRTRRAALLTRPASPSNVAGISNAIVRRISCRSTLPTAPPLPTTSRQ